MSLNHEQQSIEVSTYGPHVIAQAAQNVEEQIESGVGEYDAFAREIESIIPVLHSESFIEWATFTFEIVELYGIEDQYPSEQRDMTIADEEGWQSGVQTGFWHILKAAIESQIDDPKRIDIPRDSNKDLSKPDISAEEWVDERSQANRLPNIVFEKTLTKTISIPDCSKVFQEQKSTGATRNFEFLQYVALLDLLTHQYDLQTWRGMTDTAVRDRISNGHYCWNIVNTILDEFTLHIDSPTIQPVDETDYETTSTDNDRREEEHNMPAKQANT